MEVKNTIVIITHNSGHIIRGALSALKQSQVLVFDNASKDDTRLICKNELSNVQLIESPTNLGYGRAANKAFNKVGSKYALLLNPDVEIDHDALRALVARADKLQSNWLYIAPNTGHTVTEIDVEKQEPGLKRITDATGCALLINLENFRKLGGFDHNIFLYYEEMDLSERARNA
ncbi:MAG: glycosyltransferase family 2 protein, partial [Gammaproteobacteria bacterium]|nr:glycosyltransferase family 2 protein [Gammaproteobacteria bacterium]